LNPFIPTYRCLATRGGATALNSAITEEVEKTVPVEIFRKDYHPLPHLVSKINMDFKIEEGKTTVSSELFVEPNQAVPDAIKRDMVLDGDESCVKLLSLQINGKELVKGKDYEITPGKLILKASVLTDSPVIKTVVEIVPEENTALSGLYKSGSMYCSQMEAEGFRRVTYYPDRPGT
jgi:aminopeptidase N